GLVETLDQTGQGIADLPREDHSDRIGAILSDQTLFFPGSVTVDIQRMERAGDRGPCLRTGLQGLSRHDAAHQQSQRQRSPRGETTFHREPTSRLRKDQEPSIDVPDGCGEVKGWTEDSLLACMNTGLAPCRSNAAFALERY